MDKEVDAATTTVKDVFINRDGEYTVGISGINLSASQKYNILQIATDPVCEDRRKMGQESIPELTFLMSL